MANNQQQVAPIARAPKGGGSYLNRQRGVRDMKEYPVTSEELTSLALTQGVSTLSLAGAAGCFGFWLNGSQTIAFSEGVDAATLGFWKGLNTASLAGSVVLLVVGVILLFVAGFKVNAIKKGTTHA